MYLKLARLIIMSVRVSCKKSSLVLRESNFIESKLI